MSAYTCEDVQENSEQFEANEEHVFTDGIRMDSVEVGKMVPEFHLATDTVETSPRSGHSGASSSELFVSPAGGRERNPRSRPKSARSTTAKTVIVQHRPSPVFSSIPLPVKSSGPIKVPPLNKNSRSNNRTSSAIQPRTTILANKHTLEIQFLNKNKRYVQLRKELVEKQRPILDLYQSLMQIKKRLEEMGKSVKLEEVKLIPIDDYDTKAPSNVIGAGEPASMEVVNGMKSSIEEIPKTLMDICKNLLSRRALIVELLESVTNAEVDLTEVSDKIESLKGEGQQLQQSLDAVIREHESKIGELVNNWQKLLNEKQSHNTDSRIEELENKLKEQEKLREESSAVIQEMHNKMEERTFSYDRSVAELNGVLQTLRDQIKKLEQDLETERKMSVDFKSRNSTNAQNLKAMRVRVVELESEKRDVEGSNAELQKKIRLLQDQLKHKENQWNKEKDEMAKSLKHQENLLQKLTADKNQFETRLMTAEDAKLAKEEQLQETVRSLREELELTRDHLKKVAAERDEAMEKCSGFESYVARMGAKCKETMNRVSNSIEWGKAMGEAGTPEADNYMEDIAKDLRIRELEDKINELERARDLYRESLEGSKGIAKPRQTEKELQSQKDRIGTYQQLLEDSEKQLKDKSTEVETLRAEITQLRVRQESMEEQNERCPPQEMQRMLNEGREKLNELMSKCVQSNSKLEEYVTVIEKQKIQIQEMDKLVRYKENVTNVLKSSRNELLLEKDSLGRYSREVRAALAEVTQQIAMKDDLIKSLREKLTLRECQVRQLQREIGESEQKLQLTNEKRYKLQETVGALERELQKTRSKAAVAATPWSLLGSVCEVVEDKPNKHVSHYCDSLMAPQCSVDLDSEESLMRKRARRRRKSQQKHAFSVKSSELSYQNMSFVDDGSSAHTHCHHHANSRSLISLSLQTVDFIKTKLNYLTSVNAALPENPRLDHPSNKSLSKMLRLTAKRYGYLHNQAKESYDDLANLVKLAKTTP